jgi:hypothetical protein
LRYRGDQRHQRRLIDISEIGVPAAGKEIKFIALRVVTAGGGCMHQTDQDGRHPDDRLARE